MRTMWRHARRGDEDVTTRGRAGSIRWTTIVASLVIYATGTLLARRRGYSGLGGRTVVRCRGGHVFSTLWVPGISLKAIRLGWYRLQYCPPGRHWTLVRPIEEASLSATQLDAARATRDVPLI